MLNPGSLRASNHAGLSLLACVICATSGNATAASTCSIQGAARFGDGVMTSTFPASPGGTEYALRLSSGLLLGAGSIQFPDGTLQFTGDGAKSTAAAIGEQTGVQTSLGPCIAGSTVTLTVTGDRSVGVFFTGTASGNPLPLTVSLAVLADGAPIGGFGAAGVVQLDLTTKKNAGFFFVPSTKFSAGSHTFCLQVATSSGTYYVGDPNFNGQQFGAFEIR